jgi:Mor family transcriptional regulator
MIQEQQCDIVTAMIQEVTEVLGAVVVSESVARALESKLRLDWGGQEVYVKKGTVDVEARALDIRTRYNMVNRRELQAKWNISRGHFYKILRGG